MSHPVGTIIRAVEVAAVTALHIRAFAGSGAVKVREVIRILERDGWYLARQVGSHRQFRHPSKPGTVTVPGAPGGELKAGTMASVLRQARLKGRRG